MLCRHSTAQSQQDVVLPLDLVELILACCVRHVAISTMWSSQAISQPLNAVAAQDMPIISKAALAQMPWINVNIASRIGDVGLLRLLIQWSKQPGGRPLSPYNAAGAIHTASKCGHVSVLSWWFDESGLAGRDWTNKAVDFASAQGHLGVLQWWLNRSRMGFIPFKYSEQALVRASVAGHVHVLDWWLHSFPCGELVWSGNDAAFLYNVAKKGLVAVLDWWLQSGLPHRADRVLTGAFAGKQLGILDWIWHKQPGIVFQHRISHEDRDWLGTGTFVTQSAISSLEETSDNALCHAIKSQDPKLLVWIDRLQLFPAWKDQHAATRIACEAGDMFVIQWLVVRSWFVGDKHEWLSWAAHSGRIEVMEWLYSGVPAGEGTARSGDELFLTACRRGHVGLLDWLLDRGFCARLDYLWSQAFLYASENGHVSVLDWLWSLYCGTLPDGDVDDTGNEGVPMCELEVATLASAAVAGHLNVLEWWADHLSQFPDTLVFDNSLCGSIFAELCSTDKFPVFMWLYDQSCYGRPLEKLFDNYSRTSTYKSAIRAGNLAALDLCSQIDEHTFEVEKGACLASRLGKLEVLESLFRDGANLYEFVRAFSLCYADIDKDWYSLKALNWWRAKVFPLLKDGGQRLVARYLDDPVRGRAGPHDWFLLQSALKGLRK